MSDLVTFPAVRASAPLVTTPEAPKPICTITPQVLVVQFPNGYWTSPGMDLCLADGRTQREAAIDGLAQALAHGLRRCLST